MSRFININTLDDAETVVEVQVQLREQLLEKLKEITEGNLQGHRKPTSQQFKLAYHEGNQPWEEALENHRKLLYAKLKDKIKVEGRFKYYLDNEIINYIFGAYIAILSTVDLNVDNNS